MLETEQAYNNGGIHLTIFKNCIPISFRFLSPKIPISYVPYSLCVLKLCKGKNTREPLFKLQSTRVIPFFLASSSILAPLFSSILLATLP